MFDHNLTDEKNVFGILASHRRWKRHLARRLRSGHWLDRDLAIANVEELFQIRLREPTSPFPGIHTIGLAYCHHYDDAGRLTKLGQETLVQRMPYFEAPQMGRFKLNLDQEYVIMSVYEMARYVAWKFRCQEAEAA